MKKILLGIVLLLMAAALVMSSCSSATTYQTTRPYTTSNPPQSTTIWTTSATYTHPPYTTTAWATTATSPPRTTAPGVSTTTSGNIGLSTGGAKDVANFRANIQHYFLPLPTDISYEGLFYDYFFDTGAQEPSTKLFSPSYSYAVTKDPISGATEYYISVGLNSNIPASEFQRKKLNLVIVLDTSGSMGEYYNQYYYDNQGNQVDAYPGSDSARLNKISSAETAIAAILDQLNAGDRFAVVLFNSTASLAKPMGPVSQTNMADIKSRILDITAGGSTNLDAGLDMATAQFRNYYEINNYDYENRVIVLTDAEPNTGDTTLSNYQNVISSNAANHIYTTFIGVGIDFNSALVDNITQIKGANYYSVHSPKEFQQRIADEFDFMVTPLVFNVKLNFISSGWRIQQVYGSPEANQATGELMKINTLFPSKSEGGENKGGLVLLKLQKISNQPGQLVNLSVTYEDRNGKIDGESDSIALDNTQPEYFPNSGIRKGILLARYASLLKNWMIDQRLHVQNSSAWNPLVNTDSGIGVPPENAGQWERQSLPLKVSPQYNAIFRSFASYFQSEMNAIGDSTLDQELTILNQLANSR